MNPQEHSDKEVREQLIASGNVIVLEEREQMIASGDLIKLRKEVLREMFFSCNLAKLETCYITGAEFLALPFEVQLYVKEQLGKPKLKKEKRA